MTSRLNLSPLDGALTLLRRALTRWQESNSQDEELRDACIQRFEYTFELSWKMLKRCLELDLPDSHSVDALSFRDLIRTEAERGLITDADAWMVFRDRRSITSHTYDAVKAAAVAASIAPFAERAGELLANFQSLGAADV